LVLDGPVASDRLSGDDRSPHSVDAPRDADARRDGPSRRPGFVLAAHREVALSVELLKTNPDAKFAVLAGGPEAAPAGKALRGAVEFWLLGDRPRGPMGHGGYRGQGERERDAKRESSSSRTCPCRRAHLKISFVALQWEC